MYVGDLPHTEDRWKMEDAGEKRKEHPKSASCERVPPIASLRPSLTGQSGKPRTATGRHTMAWRGRHTSPVEVSLRGP